MKTHNVRTAAILLSLTGFAIAGNALPPLVTTLSDELAVPIEHFGYAFFAQFLAFAVASTFIATVTRGRYGRLILVLSLAVSSLLFTAAPLLRSFALLVAWFVPLGVAGGFTETQATLLIGRIDGDGSSRVLSLSQAFFCLGAIVAPQVVSLLLKNGIEWRSAFFVFAGLVGAVAIFALIAFLLPSETEPALQSKHTSANRRWYGGAFPAFAIAMFLYVVAEGVIATWLPTFYEFRFDSTPAIAAGVLSLFWIGVLSGRILVFVLPRRLSLWPALLTSAIAGSISYAVCAVAKTPNIALISIFVAGVLVGPFWPVLASVARIVTVSERAVAGVVTSGALGVAIGPFLGSRFIALFGIERLFLFVFGCSIVVGAIITVLFARSRA